MKILAIIGYALKILLIALCFPFIIALQLYKEKSEKLLLAGKKKELRKLSLILLIPLAIPYAVCWVFDLMFGNGKEEYGAGEKLLINFFSFFAKKN